LIEVLWLKGCHHECLKSWGVTFTYSVIDVFFLAITAAGQFMLIEVHNRGPQVYASVCMATQLQNLVGCIRARSTRHAHPFQWNIQMWNGHGIDCLWFGGPSTQMHDGGHTQPIQFQFILGADDDPAILTAHFEERFEDLDQFQPLQRKAWDSSPYTCRQFIEWYGLDLGCIRWNEAAPWRANGDRLADLLRQTRAASHPTKQCDANMPISTSIEKSEKASEQVPLLQTWDSVINAVQHQESPTVVGRLEASLVVEQLWAGYVEHSFRNACNHCISHDGAHVEIALLTFNRNSQEMVLALFGGVPLRSCRNALQDHGFPFKLTSRCMMFVQPIHYKDVVHALEEQCLKPSQVTVETDPEYLVEGSLAGIPNKVWAKSCEPFLAVTQEDLPPCQVPKMTALLPASAHHQIMNPCKSRCWIGMIMSTTHSSTCPYQLWTLAHQQHHQQ